jgi:hypothetical protein
MKIENLKSLKKRIEETEDIGLTEYFEMKKRKDLPGRPMSACFCAVGHVFLEGGATEEEIKKFSQKTSSGGRTVNALGISNIVNNHLYLVDSWLREAGFDPENGLDVVFLEELQRINDRHDLLEDRREGLLKYIDETISILEKKTEAGGESQ